MPVFNLRSTSEANLYIRSSQKRSVSCAEYRKFARKTKTTPIYDKRRHFHIKKSSL